MTLGANHVAKESPETPLGRIYGHRPAKSRYDKVT